MRLSVLDAEITDITRLTLLSFENGQVGAEFVGKRRKEKRKNRGEYLAREGFRRKVILAVR